MTARFFKWVAACLCLAFMAGCAGYPVKERDAREMLNRALLLYQEGESENADRLLLDIKDNYADTAAATEAIRMLLGQNVEDYGKIPCSTADCMDRILEAAVEQAEKTGTSEAKRDVITLAVLLGKYAGDGEMPSFPAGLDDYDEGYPEDEADDERSLSDPALETLKNAYMAAMAFFLDKPGSVATLPALEEYGLRVPRGVSLIIADGREENLSIRSFREEGDKIYSIDSEGVITEGPRPGAERPKRGDEGHRTGHALSVMADKTAEADLKSAYVAAQVFFIDSPQGPATLKSLAECGFKASEGVTVTVEKGGEDDLSISARHEKGATVFRIDASGGITREPKK